MPPSGSTGRWSTICGRTRFPAPGRRASEVLVCVDESVDAERLVRGRTAERRGAAWVAVTVENTRSYALTEEKKDYVSKALRLVSQLGGETTILQGEDVVATILHYARERNATQIIVGRASRRPWFKRLGPR